MEWLGNIIFQNVTITAKKLSNQTYIRFTIQQFRYLLNSKWYGVCQGKLPKDLGFLGVWMDRTFGLVCWTYLVQVTKKIFLP